jgi:hypothetical protein
MKVSGQVHAMNASTLEGRLPDPTGQEDGCTSETVGTHWSGERHLDLHLKPNSDFPVFQPVVRKLFQSSGTLMACIWKKYF